MLSIKEHPNVTSECDKQLYRNVQVWQDHGIPVTLYRVNLSGNEIADKAANSAAGEATLVTATNTTAMSIFVGISNRSHGQAAGRMGQGRSRKRETQDSVQNLT